MTYTILSLLERPALRDTMADWFSQKWSVPKSAYLESMDDCLSRRAPVPRWYVALEKDRIIGGLGVIENDFHDRKDLAPNVCAVFVEPDRRGQGIAGKLLERVCSDMAAEGIDPLYLLTDHIGFYERYGWEFLCMVQGDGEPQMARMYVHYRKD